MINRNYTTPKLNNCKGDLSKSWYIYFVFEYEGEKKQFRVKDGINFLKTKKEREEFASVLINIYVLRLKEGWNPFTKEIKEEIPDITISQALDDILSVKKSYITPRSYKTYKDEINLFKKWLVIAKFDKLFVHNFTNKQARGYFDWLLKVKKYCGKTHNGHLSILSTFFNSFVERQLITESPIKGIKKVRQDTGKNITYSPVEEQKFIKYTYTNDKPFYYATRFVKYGFFRRTELGLLQIKHIKWENKTIVIPSENSKGRDQNSVTIPESLEKIIIEMNILELDPELYIFGEYFKPNTEPIKMIEYFSKTQREINKLIEVPSKGFYAWKHTGCIELYNIVKDPYVIMRQCRHSNIKDTMTYLRSLGCGVNEEVRRW